MFLLEHILQDQDQPQNADFSSARQQSVEKQAWTAESKGGSQFLQNHSLEEPVGLHCLESREISLTRLKLFVNIL